MALQRPNNARPADPCCFVIFGATGDLTHRLLVPALYNLAATGLLPEAFCILGVGRREESNEQFRQGLLDGLRQFATRAIERPTAERLLAHVGYVRGELDDPSNYDRLHDALNEFERSVATLGNRLFYLATPPQAFGPVADRLAAAKLLHEESGAWRRVIVEKPFGTDLESARQLNHQLQQVLREEQIYRIDHYLGKETVQNIMVMRFANGLFEPIWNRHHIDHVQITVAETLGVGRRGAFYDQTGALRDMVPNHLFQLLALTAMEPPSCFDASSVRSEKAKALCAIRLATAEEALAASVRGQYTAGTVDGKLLPGYRQTANVDPASTTETYVALRLDVDNWRWAGVPFYLRTGKALVHRETEIAIKFRQAPYAMFRDTPVDHLVRNFLVLRIQPDEGIALNFNVKVPGPSILIAGADMSFNYRDYFDAAPATGYETLIYDCMTGDQTLFQRADGVEAGWRAVQPFLDAWSRASAAGLVFYAAGSDGPKEASMLLQRDGRSWRIME
ncbi:MAG: glucose-6-phosphate dehydrogenase [Xanthobacteraceae bacterium]